MVNGKQKMNPKIQRMLDEMAAEKRTVKTEVQCPKCGSNDLKKGLINSEENKTAFKCSGCGKEFFVRIIICYGD